MRAVNLRLWKGDCIFFMPFYNQEEIEKARQVDLFTYLQTCEPQELVHVSGNVYCTREHDSLRISNGKWCWFSRGIGGGRGRGGPTQIKRGDFFGVFFF